MTVHVFAELIGKVATDIRLAAKDDEMILTLSDGLRARWYHRQDCCESVDIEDVCGDPQDLVGSPLLVAEEVDNDPPSAPGPYCESCTWTFYRFATAKGSVTVRWYGTSNGYYSESVDYEFGDGTEDDE